MDKAGHRVLKRRKGEVGRNRKVKDESPSRGVLK